MTGAELIRALLDYEVQHPGIINRPILLHPHGRYYRQPFDHIYPIVAPKELDEKDIVLVFEARRE